MHKRPVAWLVSMIVVSAAAVSIVVAVPGVSAAGETTHTPRSVDPRIVGYNWWFQADQNRAWLGWALNTAGDVNGDGYQDIIVSAHRYDSFFSDDGKVFVFHGSVAGLNTTPDWTAIGAWEGAKLGHSVGSAGDVNGDGYDDVIVGVPSPNGNGGFGWAYAYYGSDTGLSLAPDWTVEGPQAQAWFGRTVASAGDVNGDGYDDVVVGAPHWDNGQNDEGRAYLYLGSATGLETTEAWVTESDQPGALYARWIETTGDVNGDGYDDVAVGAHFYDDNQADEGRTFVYYGSPTGLNTTADWFADGNQRRGWFGRAVSTAGDVNGDGYDDLMVGAPKYDSTFLNSGATMIFFGSATGLSASPDWTTYVDQAEAWYGRRLGPAGDVNGDGYADVVIGAPNYDIDVLADAGRTYVFYGSATGPALTAEWVKEFDQANGWFGRAVSSAGDVNGDGYAEVLIGAPNYIEGQLYEGAAYVFNGSSEGLPPP